MITMDPPPHGETLRSEPPRRPSPTASLLLQDFGPYLRFARWPWRTHQAKSEAIVISVRLLPCTWGPHHHSIVPYPFLCLSLLFLKRSGGLIERKSTALSSSLPSTFMVIEPFKYADTGIFSNRGSM